MSFPPDKTSLIFEKNYSDIFIEISDVTRLY